MRAKRQNGPARRSYALQKGDPWDTEGRIRGRNPLCIVGTNRIQRHCARTGVRIKSYPLYAVVHETMSVSPQPAKPVVSRAATLAPAPRAVAAIKGPDDRSLAMARPRPAVPACSNRLGLLPYRRGRFTPVLGNTSPASGDEIGQRFPAHPPQRHPGAFLVGPARHLVQRAPREAALDAGVANLDRLVGDPGGNQQARQFVRCSVARPSRIMPAINLALGLENARPFRRPGVFERPLPHGDHRPSPRRRSRRRRDRRRLGSVDRADFGAALCRVRLEHAATSCGDEFSAALCPPPTIAVRAGTLSCQPPPGRDLGPAHPHLGDSVAPGPSRGAGLGWWEEWISRCAALEYLHTRGLSAGGCRFWSAFPAADGGKFG